MVESQMVCICCPVKTLNCALAAPCQTQIVFAGQRESSSSVSKHTFNPLPIETSVQVFTSTVMLRSSEDLEHEKIQNAIRAAKMAFITSFSGLTTGYEKALHQNGYLAMAPIQAIIPMPTSMASSSILNNGVCTPAVIPFCLLAVPSLKKHPGICCE